MSDFKRWFSYIFSYDTGGRRRNIGFAKVDAREGKCRLQICVRGIYGSDGRKLDVGIYSWGPDGPQRASVGKLYIRGGAGEYTAVTKTDNLFDSGISLEKSGGLWLTGPQADAVHLAAWDKEELDIRDFLTQVREKPVYVSAASVSAAAESAAAGIVSADMAAGVAAPMSPPQSASADGGQLQVIDVARLPEPDLWESLCRYYPKTGAELLERGIELLQIRPADIRYLPRRLWHYGSNSFLLHGYYHYRHLILGRISRGGKKEYILGVRGKKEKRESFSAGLFGFEYFLALGGNAPDGYWYTPITLEPER
ncbi:MAG: hypothetical protein HFI39_06485 [Lachnospiraceae bacterium]|nr:hypothetical protein [Lachnospiraceae bacterium]